MISASGGPAFPVESTSHAEFGLSGMTLRDYFAAKAMQSLLPILDGRGTEVTKLVADLAFESYRVADSMIAERNK